MTDTHICPLLGCAYRTGGDGLTHYAVPAAADAGRGALRAWQTVARRWRRVARYYEGHGDTVFEMVAVDNAPQHRFTNQGVCIRCGADMEEWDAGCVEEELAAATAAADESRARVRELEVEVAATRQMLDNMLASIKSHFSEAEWEAARTEIFSNGNSGWTMVHGAAVANLRAQLESANSELALEEHMHALTKQDLAAEQRAHQAQAHNSGQETRRAARLHAALRELAGHTWSGLFSDEKGDKQMCVYCTELSTEWGKPLTHKDWCPIVAARAALALLPPGMLDADATAAALAAAGAGGEA